MPRSIGDRVEDAFSGGERSDISAYSKDVLSAIKDLVTSLNKAAVLIFATMAFFELLSYQPAGKQTVLGITVEDTFIVQVALPPLVSFLVYDAWTQTVRYVTLQRTMIDLTARLLPLRMRSNDLDFLVMPSLPAMWAIGDSGSKMNALYTDKVAYAIRLFSALTLAVLLPVAFSIQAYTHLFHRYHVGNGWTWVSLTLTVLVTACTAIFVGAHIKDRWVYIEEDKKNKEGEDKENQELAQAAADADSQESSGGE
jgi:hypothetical protein